MKNIKFILLTLSLLIFITAGAQTPLSRTKNIVIDNALAQIPLNTPEKYNRIMTDLISTGEEGLLDLIGRMNPPGNESNETLEYAISGWTHFAAGDDIQRSIAANAFGKALNRPLDNEVKAFVIRQLRTIGTDNDVDVLSRFLSDEKLSSPASLALVSIGTDKACDALSDALADAGGEQIRLNLSNALEQADCSKTEKVENSFRILFDGTNLDQWTGNKRDYLVEEGNIVLYPSEGSGGNLYTIEEFSNFVLHLEFMLTPGANNGLGIRTPLKGDAAYVGMELQILDNDAPEYEDLQTYQYHGSVYGVIPAERGYLKPVGEWNYQEVIADGDNIKVILNGTTILDGNIREASEGGTMDKRDHPGLLNKAGHIAFLGHGSKVKFRNIRIKEL